MPRGALSGCFRSSFPSWIGILCLAAVVLGAHGQTPPQLTIRRPLPGEKWVRLNSSMHAGTVLTLEASTNLTAWREIGTLHDALLEYPDAASDDFQQRFYRVRATPRETNDDSKSAIRYPWDPFL